MTLLEALMKAGYSKEDAENQVENGAWLWEVEDYVKYMSEEVMSDKEIEELKEQIENNIKGTSDELLEGLSIVFDGEKPMILEVLDDDDELILDDDELAELVFNFLHKEAAEEDQD